MLMTPVRGLVFATPPISLWKYKRIVRFVRKLSTPRMTAIFGYHSTHNSPACLPHFASSGTSDESTTILATVLPRLFLDKPLQEIFSSPLVESAGAIALDVASGETSGLRACVPVEHPAQTSIPKSAQNDSFATRFIQFLCRTGFRVGPRLTSPPDQSMRESTPPVPA